MKLQDIDGIIGVITSAGFHGMETMDRQDLIDEIIKANLEGDDRYRVQIIVGVTPDEGTGYLASVR